MHINGSTVGQGQSQGLEHDASWLSVSDAERIKDIARYEPQDPAVNGDKLKTLPIGTRPVRLVGEGAANAVFEFELPEGHPSVHLFKNKLLRVAKVKELGQTAKFDYIAQHKYFLRDIRPRLREYVVEQELVQLHHAGDLVEQMNNILQAIDSTRRPKFQGSFVGKSTWAFLLENMQPQDHEEYELIEFKPKWLVQSPNAPANAIRCRQCACELRNLITRPDDPRPLPKQSICPLTLGRPEGGHHKFSSPFRIAPRLISLATSPRMREHLETVLDLVANHPVIHRLRAIQLELDTHGPLKPELNPLLPQAMTLRDCTCFASIPKNPGASKPVKVALVDFDWKDPEVKLEHWRSREAGLINGGFYTAGKILCGDKYFQPPTLCLLEQGIVGPNASEIMVIVDEPTQEAENVVPTKTEDGIIYTHHTDAATLKERLTRHEDGREGDVHDPHSLKDPTR